MDDNDRPVLKIIQDIKSGTVDPKKLDRDVRKQCVETLMLEGYNVPQIAQIMGCSEKTIRRDIAQIRERNALAPSVDLCKRMVGDLLMKAEAHRVYLMRLARNPEGSISEKSQSEYLAWKVTEDLIKLLQTMGYMPQKPKEVIGDIIHRMANQETEKSFEELKGVLNDVLSVAEEAGTVSPDLKDSVNALKARLEKANIEYEAKKLLNQQESQNKESENGSDIQT